METTNSTSEKDSPPLTSSNPISSCHSPLVSQYYNHIHCMHFCNDQSLQRVQTHYHTQKHVYYSIVVFVLILQQCMMEGSSNSGERRREVNRSASFS